MVVGYSHSNLLILWFGRTFAFCFRKCDLFHTLGTVRTPCTELVLAIKFVLNKSRWIFQYQMFLIVELTLWPVKWSRLRFAIWKRGNYLLFFMTWRCHQLNLGEKASFVVAELFLCSMSTARNGISRYSTALFHVHFCMVNLHFQLLYLVTVESFSIFFKLYIHSLETSSECSHMFPRDRGSLLIAGNYNYDTKVAPKLRFFFWESYKDKLLISEGRKKYCVQTLNNPNLVFDDVTRFW